jgi:hypothetical protein
LSAFGGAVYLLNVALELSVGEMLWRACLPEGRMLAHALAGIIGAADDAAPWILGGVEPADPEPTVTSEQQREVAVELLHALVETLPRRGHAVLPTPSLGAVDTKHGRLFVATAVGAPFVLFAMPAESPGEVRTALDSFLSTWPASAPTPRGARGLLALDRTARVIASASSANTCDAYVADSGSLPACALLTQIMGAMAQIFAARVDLSPMSRGELVRRHLAIPCRIVRGDEVVEVNVPMSYVDIKVRRAALDRNPGWIPWLQKRVEIVYAEDESSLSDG